MQTVLKKIDFYGNSINFLVDGSSNRVNSPIGGAMTIVTFLFLLFSFAVFGQDFYYKLNPKLTIQDKLMGDDEIQNLIDYGISNKTIVFKAQKVMVDFSNFLVDIAVPNTSYTQKIYDLVDYCSDDYVVKAFYAGNSTAANKDKNDYSYLCYDLGKYPFGLNNDQQTYGSPLVIPVSIWTFRCGKTARGIKGRDCPVNLDLTKNDAVELEIWTHEVLYNQDDILNPFFSNLIRVTRLITSRSHEAISWLSIKKHISHDNFGFMLDSFTDKEDYGASEFYTLVAALPNPNDFYDFTLYTGFQRKYLKYTRTYMKFQDLLAIVGGVVKSIFTFFQLTLYFLNDRNVANLIIKKMNYDLSEPNSKVHFADNIENNNLEKSNVQLNPKNEAPLEIIKNNYIDKTNSKIQGAASKNKRFCCNLFRTHEELMLYKIAKKTQSIDSLTSTYKKVEVISSVLFSKEQISALELVRSNPKKYENERLTEQQLKLHFEKKQREGQLCKTDLLLIEFTNF